MYDSSGNLIQKKEESSYGYEAQYIYKYNEEGFLKTMTKYDNEYNPESVITYDYEYY